MSWLDGLRHRVRTIASPDRYADELRDEMRLHQELAAEERGDRVRARRRFGNEVWYAEEARRMTWLSKLDPLLQDVRYAWRNVLRAPGFTFVVVLTLALGVGVNAVMFSLLDRIYLRPPGGVTEPETLRRIWIEHPSSMSGDPFTSQAMNYPIFRAISDAAGDAELAVFTMPWEMRLGREAGAARVRVSFAASNLFDVLGVRAAAGRFFTAEEDRLGAGVEVAVVSDAFRRRYLGGSVVPGAQITLEGRTHTVIGVADPSFTGLDLNPADVWVPLGTKKSPAWLSGPWWESFNIFDLNAVMRSADVDPSFARRATARLDVVFREEYPEREDGGRTVHTGSIIEARGPGEARQDQLITTRLAGVAAIVLLIACANVVNLLLARAVQRRRENAVRLALGIPYSRLARATILETLMLALLAAVGALLAAAWGGAALRAVLLPDVEWRAPVLDPRLALFTIGIAVCAGLLAAIVPAAQSARVDLTRTLKSGTRQSGRQRSRLRSVLVALQAALSVVLLVGAALFIQSLRNVQGLDIGYEPDRILFGRIEFGLDASPAAAVRAATLAEVAQQLQQRPGVEAVATASINPMAGFSVTGFHTETDSLGSFDAEMPTVTAVTPSYFRVTGIDIVQGRPLREAANEVVVNERMAALAWPERDAVGQCMYFEGRGGACTRVVGVARNARRDRVIEDSDIPQYYLPLGHPAVENLHGTAILVRTYPGAAAQGAAELREALRTAFPGSLPTVLPMIEYLEPQYRPWRLGAQLFTALGMLALLVALIGIFTSVSYGVTQRTHEFGVRMALGARVGDVLRQVLGEGVRVVAFGVIAGILLTLALGRLATALLYGVEPHDTSVLAAVSLIVITVAAAAALLPAWRAARVDPLRTLRED